MSAGYRLESLLTLRRREEDAAKKLLVAAQAELVGAQERITAAEAEVELRRGALSSAQVQLAAPVTRRAAEREAVEHFVTRRRGELGEAQRLLADAEAARVRAEEAVVTARDALCTRARDREAVEKHRERWQATQRREAAHREEKMLAELANRRGPGRDGGAS